MNRILRTIASVALIASALSVSAQEKTIVFADWNIRSFEKSNGAGQNIVPVDEYVDFIKTFNADIITFNEFETVTSREGAEKMAEVAKELGMFGYFIESYPKGGDGFYGGLPHLRLRRSEPVRPQSRSSLPALPILHILQS